MQRPDKKSDSCIITLPIIEACKKWVWRTKAEYITCNATILKFKVADCYFHTFCNACPHKGFKWKLANKNSSLEPEKKKRKIFNEYLWEKMGKPKTLRSNPIPVLNLSGDTLDGEFWKPIEGWEESFEVSNLGRIKSIGRLKGNKVWLKEHILRLVPDGNQFRTPSSLLVSIKKGGKSYQKSIAPLVYYHLVKNFDLNDKSKKVHFKDNRFYNLDYKNLVLK